MAMRVCWWGIISLAVTKRAASTDLVAEAITNLMIWAMERAHPIKKWEGIILRKKDVSSCAAAGVGFIEESCIHVSTQDHITRPVNMQSAG